MPLQRKVKGFFLIYDDSKSPPQLLITIAGVKTRNQSYSKLSELVGPGKELLSSEVPTHCAASRRASSSGRGEGLGRPRLKSIQKI